MKGRRARNARLRVLREGDTLETGGTAASLRSQVLRKFVLYFQLHR